MTRSSSSCGMQAGPVGLTTALCSRVGKPTSTGVPEAASASVGVASARHSTSIAAASARSSRPQERSSSIVAVLTPVARGWRDGAGRFSITSVSMPARASVIAAVSPAGPAPTTTTGEFCRTVCLMKARIHSVGQPVQSKGYDAGRGHPPLRAAARADDAEKTRQRIIDAVAERLRAAPSEPIAVERIAEMAGVARSTVYAIFGSRGGLFDAVGQHLHERAGYARLVEESLRPDARDGAARRPARGDARCWPPTATSSARCTRWRSSIQEAVGGAVQRWEQERAAAMRRIARSLHEQGHLQPGVSVEEANDILWVITSFESFDLLYTGRGLPLDASSSG